MRRTPLHASPAHGPWWWRRTLSRVAVLTLSGALAAGSVAMLAGAASSAKQEQVRAELAHVAVDIEAYRVCHGAWPTTLAEVYGETPLDPWGHPYVLAPPAGARVEPDVLALGADGWPGGWGVGSDLWMSDVRDPDFAYENYPPGC